MNMTPNIESMILSFKAGDSSLVPQILKRLHPFVNAIARHIRTKTLTNEDLLVEGNLALLDAAKRYDPVIGSEFKKFAGVRVRGAMLSFVRKYERVISLPSEFQTLRNTINDAKNSMVHTLHREPTTTELAEFLDISEKKIKETMIFCSPIVYIDDEGDDSLRHQLLNQVFISTVAAVA